MKNILVFLKIIDIDKKWNSICTTLSWNSYCNHILAQPLALMAPYIVPWHGLVSIMHSQMFLQENPRKPPYHWEDLQSSNGVGLRLFTRRFLIDALQLMDSNWYVLSDHFGLMIHNWCFATDGLQPMVFVWWFLTDLVFWLVVFNWWVLIDRVLTDVVQRKVFNW